LLADKVVVVVFSILKYDLQQTEHQVITTEGE